MITAVGKQKAAQKSDSIDWQAALKHMLENKKNNTNKTNWKETKHTAVQLNKLQYCCKDFYCFTAI